MGYAIGHFFAIATKFDVEAKKKAEAMFESIRDQFRIILSESFLDAPTKVKAQEKLNAMTPRMGYDCARFYDLYILIMLLAIPRSYLRPQNCSRSTTI